jgi:hypothetical protein
LARERRSGKSRVRSLAQDSPELGDPQSRERVHLDAIALAQPDRPARLTHPARGEQPDAAREATDAELQRARARADRRAAAIARAIVKSRFSHVYGVPTARSSPARTLRVDRDINQVAYVIQLAPAYGRPMFKNASCAGAPAVNDAPGGDLHGAGITVRSPTTASTRSPPPPAATGAP